MWIVPVAVAQAMLPAMASAFRLLPESTAGLLRRGALLMLALTLPACLVLAASGGFVLRLWLGADFAAEGGTVLRLLAAGIFFSCLAFAPNALLEAIGRPDAAAKFLLVQVVVFLPLSALLLWGFGIAGAALAWALRAAADCAGKFWLAAGLYPAAAPAARGLAPGLLAAGLTLAVTALAPEGAWSWGAAGLGLIAAVALTLRALTAEEHQALRPLLRRPWQAGKLLKA
jgi:O-antigen/teichoic acid export membrane protein